MRTLKPYLFALVALVALTAPAAAEAKAKVGVADNSPLIFSDAKYLALKSAFTRKIVPIDTISKGGADLTELDQYMAAAGRLGIEVLITFNPTRAHFTPGRSKKADLPSTASFTKEFKAFRKRYPSQKVFSPWNEINSPSQPTAFNVKRAADYSNIAAKNCKGCKIVAGDFLDISNLTRYYGQFVKRLKFKPKYWGLHNYGDTNRFRNRATKLFLKLTKKGEVWLTETGGFAKFCKADGTCDFPYDEARQVKAINQMFKLANSNRRITRLYIYEYRGKPASERFDAGLINADGSVRQAYNAVKAKTAP